MKNIMIDIETLGTKPFSVILSIAALKFDIQTGQYGDIFYKRIDPKSCVEYGLDFDIDTVLWWLEQPDAARKEFSNESTDILPVLLDLMLFIGEDTETCIWSNSPSFDLSLIRQACEQTRVDVAWKYNQERDVRTISALDPKIRESVSFPGDIHKAIDDCRFQVIYLVEILNRIKI